MKNSKEQRNVHLKKEALKAELPLFTFRLFYVASRKMFGKIKKRRGRRDTNIIIITTTTRPQQEPHRRPFWLERQCV